MVKSMKPVKISKREDDLKELELKKKELKECEDRINGTGQFRMPIDKEIEKLKRVIEAVELEIKGDRPIQAKYEFELNERWRELRREDMNEVLAERKNILAKVLEQKERILNEQIPALVKRIADLS